MLPISGDQLTQLIPQKPPFVFISALTEVSEQTCTTTFRFEADHVLCENGKLSSAGLMENIAQTSGCKLGYEDFMKGKTHSRAFIGEIRDFIYTRLPKVGEELTTVVTIESKVFGVVAVASAVVKVNDVEIASCKMKIFFEPEPEVQNN
jgi:predicted hotdog family 3-hydroxylacyl-ACP dehydratase